MIGTERAGGRRFLIVVPNRVRDLEGHALVGYHLVREHGHQVVFCNIPQLRETMLRLAPDVVVIDRVDTNVSIARLAKSLGMKLALLPTVGFTSDTVEIEARRAGKLVAGEQLLDCCFTWGTFARDMILEQTHLVADTVCITGSPRFDVYSEPYLSQAEPRDSLLSGFGIANPHAPLVVWSTNTFHARTRELERAVAAAVATGVDETEIRAQLDDEGIAFHDLAHATQYLARRHPEWNFLIKLHPSEEEGPYRDVAKGYDNIALARLGRIRDVLYHCAALITNTSTTATEAWLLDRTVFEVELTAHHMESPGGYADGSYLVKRLEELDQLLTRHVSNPATPLPESQRRARADFIERVYYKIDGRSGARCAHALSALVAPPRHTDAMQRDLRAAAHDAHTEWRRAAERRTGTRVKRALGMREQTTLRFWTSAFWSQRPGRERPIWDRDIADATVQALFDGFDRAHAAADFSGQLLKQH